MSVKPGNFRFHLTAVQINYLKKSLLVKSGLIKFLLSANIRKSSNVYSKGGLRGFNGEWTNNEIRNDECAETNLGSQQRPPILRRTSLQYEVT